MKRSWTAVLAWMICGVALAGCVAFLIMELSGGAGPATAQFLSPAQEAIGATAYAVVGTLIVIRQRGNTIGWLFLLVAFSSTVSGIGAALSDTYATASAPWTFGVFLNTFSWVPGWFVIVSFLLLLFPDGHLPSPRYRWVGWLAGASIVLATAVGMLSRTAGNTAGYVSPLPTIPEDVWAAAIIAGFVGLLVAAVASIVGLVRRYRASTGVERDQLRWFVYAGVVTIVLFPTRTVSVNQSVLLLLGLLSILVLPVAVGIAILKHRLYDISVVINKTFLYAGLAAFITLVYVGVVVGLGALIGANDQTSVPLSIAATAIVAVAFQPVRERLQRFANQLVYGKRATPYEVLTRFSERVGSTYANEDVLPRTVHVIAEGVNAERATIWLRLADELRPASTWPDDAHAPARSVPLNSDDLAEIDGEHVAAIRHRGELLGAITIEKPPGEVMRPEEVKLVDDLASQAGLVVSNVRLTADLEARLAKIAVQGDQLKASRQRIVAAQDEERRRLERNIHDGAQQHLVALAVKLRLARALIARDRDKATTMLREITGQVDDALDTLRTLALGIYPPLLEEHGIAAALAAQYQRNDLPVHMAVDGAKRYPIEMEAAVYFCVLEALQNAAKYARAGAIEVSLGEHDGILSFEVVDDGVGFDREAIGEGTGLGGMRDRLAVLGGEVELTSAPGSGTTVRGRVPLALEAVSS